MSINSRSLNPRHPTGETARDKELEGQIQECLQRWRRRATWLGMALLVTIIAIIPFLYGHPLHREWDTIGRKLVLLSMCLLLAFMYAVGTAFNFWLYLRETKKIHRELPPLED